MKSLAAVVIAVGISANANAQTQLPGTLDTTFNPVFGPNYASTVQAVSVQPDGKVLVAGDFLTVGGTTAQRIARLTTTGALDTSFTANPGADGMVRVIQNLADGKVMVAGDFYAINGAGWRGLARLTSTGTPDSTFGLFSGVVGNVYAMAVQPDGKILIGGSFTKVNTVDRMWIARLTSSGALDTSFTPFLDGAVMSIVVRPNGKILVGGDFKNVNNSQRAYLVQLDSTGNVDTSFTSSVDWTINTIALQTNGQAVIGGWFNLVDGIQQNYVARLNLNGTRDSTFTANSSGVVYNVMVHPTGRILVGGRFSYMNSTQKYNLAVLNSNGLLDAEFNPGNGPDNTVRSISLQSDGKLIIGGDFTQVAMQPRKFAARIWGYPPPPTVSADGLQIWTAVEIGWNSQLDATYKVQWAPEANSTVWQDLENTYTGTGSQMTVLDSTRANGRRFYRVIKTSP